MKTVILAGGAGTRMAEETQVKPKPMVEIGGRPILWHIMRHYASHGFKEFVVALGYKSEMIKAYFLDYCRLRCSMTVDLSSGGVELHDGQRDDWTVHLIDTGLNTQVGGRLKRLSGWIGRETFMMTYGDGVAGLDIDALVAFHRRHGRIATLTAVRPPARFGALSLQDELVADFMEKPQVGEGWINGGFFVFEPQVLNYIEGDDTILEHGPLERLAREGQLAAFRHEGFWQCMDTMRDVRLLQTLWDTGQAPWLPRNQALRT